MELSLPVLVSADQRDRYEIVLPGLSTRSFTGPSLAALLDDVALHLMEVLPAEDPASMTRYEACPHVELRKVKITAKLKGETRKDERSWTGRLAVVLTRWPEDQFHVAVVPRLGNGRFALESPRHLEAALASFVEAWAEEHDAGSLDERTCRHHEYLEILNFDADLPSILPSRPAPPKKKKRPKKRKNLTPEEAAAEAAERRAKAKKRVLVPPAVLRSVAVNLTHRALDGRLGRAHLRERLSEEITSQLDHEGTGILLVGPSGAGKTALVHEVVRRLAAESTKLSERRDVWQVDGNRLISGMSMVGAWEQRVAAMVTELSLRQDILYVADLPALVYTGRSAHSNTNVAEFLEPHLARGDLRIIGECTPERLLATRDEAPGFFARFRVIPVADMSEREALSVLVHVVRTLGERELLSVAPEALESVLALTRRFEAARVHPGKSVGLLSRVLSDHGEVRRDELGRRVIDRPKVIDVFAREAGLPRFVLWEKEARRHGEILEFFSRRIIAQPQAVEAACDVVALLEQGLNDPARPISTFLFVGPTGVGKTETAKALAELLFGSADRMIRFDMSEMLHPETVARLFGDRFHPDGELTRRVQQQPFSVVLLDEIEKAHPAVFDALLQVLGEGRLTNAAGRTIDFTSTVIVMTSNLGVRDAGKRLGFDTGGAAALDAHYRAAAERWFRPEFFNRIDRVVAFSPLGRDAIAPLVGRLMEAMLGRRGLRRSSVVVDVDPELVDLVIDQGFDERYGARSIKRVLEQKLAVPLARHLVERRGTELTLAELYPCEGRIEMSLVRPRPRVRAAIATMEPIRDWRVLEARFAALVGLLEQVAASDRVYALEAERTRAMAQFRAGDRTDADRMLLLGDLLDQLSGAAEASLRRDLDDFHHRYVEVEAFAETLVSDDDVYAGADTIKKTKTLVAPDARPVRTDRPPLAREIGGALEALEIRFAGLVYRVHAALEPPSRPLLLRFVPVSRGPRPWALELARDFAAAFTRGGLASARVFAREVSGAWRDDDGGGGEAGAVELSGSALAVLVEPELGYWASTVELGPELITDVVRVDEVGDAGDAPGRLAALDRAELERRRARRDGRDAGAEPAAELARWFERGVARDAETGLELRAAELADHLYAVIMRRILAQVRAEEAAS